MFPNDLGALLGFQQRRAGSGEHKVARASRAVRDADGQGPDFWNESTES